MQSPENNEKYIVPRCYSTILQQIQSCAQRRHCCNQIPHAISSCQGNVAHVHRINGSLYFHKLPLAIAMIVTINDTRAWRRYQLVLACRDKLRLPLDVLAALESRTRDHVLTQQFFPPTRSIGNTCMVMLLMVADFFSGCVQPIMDLQHLFIDIEATRSSFTWVYRIGNSS